MGIDKSMHEDSPVVVIDGTVYQYGKSPELIACTGEPWDPPQWLVEHHSYAKDYYCFASEQDMLDFIDGLPDSTRPPFKWSPRQSDEERERRWEKVRQWRHKLAERKRAEKGKEVSLTPAHRYVKEARAMIDAVLERHLKPHEDWNDPDIERQVGLILRHHMKLYREATAPPPTEPDQAAEPSDDDIPF